MMPRDWCCNFWHTPDIPSWRHVICSFICCLGRVKLLTELHWRLPRPLTPAEEHLGGVRIPDAEAALEELRQSVQVMAASGAVLSVTSHMACALTFAFHNTSRLVSSYIRC